MTTCKFHPELYQYSKNKSGHRIINPARGKEVKCPTCGTMIILGQPHPPVKNRRRGYLGHLIIPVPPTSKKDLDKSGYVKEELMVDDDNNVLLWAALQRRPRKNEPMLYTIPDQTVVNEDESQKLYNQPIYDVHEDGRQARGYVWIRALDEVFLVIRIRNGVWQITSSDELHD